MLAVDLIETVRHRALAPKRPSLPPSLPFYAVARRRWERHERLARYPCSGCTGLSPVQEQSNKSSSHPRLLSVGPNPTVVDHLLDTWRHELRTINKGGEMDLFARPERLTEITEIYRLLKSYRIWCRLSIGFCGKSELFVPSHNSDGRCSTVAEDCGFRKPDSSRLFEVGEGHELRRGAESEKDAGLS